MRTSLSTAAVLAASSQMAAALTPIGSIPAVNATLGVAYNRTIIDGTQLFDPARAFPMPSYLTLSLVVLFSLTPSAHTHTASFRATVLQTAPNVSYVPENTTVMALNDTSSASTSNGTYMLLMIDLSLPASRVTLDPSLIVPGLEANDSTRLHWWQGNLTSVDMSAAAVSNTSNLTTAFDTFLVPSSPAVARYVAPPLTQSVTRR
jgi:hypothetical protein